MENSSFKKVILNKIKNEKFNMAEECLHAQKVLGHLAFIWNLKHGEMEKLIKEESVVDFYAVSTDTDDPIQLGKVYVTFKTKLYNNYLAFVHLLRKYAELYPRMEKMNEYTPATSEDGYNFVVDLKAMMPFYIHVDESSMSDPKVKYQLEKYYNKSSDILTDVGDYLDKADEIVKETETPYKLSDIWRKVIKAFRDESELYFTLFENISRLER